MWAHAACGGLLCLVAAFSSPARADCTPEIVSGEYVGATDRYPHGVLGDPFEWSRLRVTLATPPGCSASPPLDVVLPESLVFEDTAPRAFDVDNDGALELVTVESHQTKGARLSIWGIVDGEPARIAATPHIGTRFRWLAPVAVADLDGDGAVELAFVDRPHLAKTLRIWRFEDGTLAEVVSAPGFSNHRIGETGITSGMRDCGNGIEMVVPSDDWRRVMAVTLSNEDMQVRDLGAFSQASFSAALDCKDG